jgi:hypothetical protein
VEAASLREAARVHQQIVSAWQERDWDRVRSLLHPEGLFESTAAGGRTVDAEGFLNALIEADRTVYSVYGLSYEPLADGAVIVSGYVRQPRRRGHSLSRVVWLVEVREGLAYRSTPFATRESALAEYEQRSDLASALLETAVLSGPPVTT